MKNFLPRGEFMVLCHGAHLEATNWFEMVIGDLENDQAGRAPRAIEIALMYGAKKIIWATGASEKVGKKEAVYTYETALAHLPQIRDYLIRRQVIDEDITVMDLDEKMLAWALFDTVTQNTTEEVTAAIKMAKVFDCKAIVQVSSATHIQRCFAEAVKINYSLPIDQKIRFVPIEADTCFPNSTPADVVVSEPPHRGDNLTIWLPRLFRAFFRLSTWEKDRARVVINDVCAVLMKHDIIVDPDMVLPRD